MHLTYQTLVHRLTLFTRAQSYFCVYWWIRNICTQGNWGCWRKRTQLRHKVELLQKMNFTRKTNESDTTGNLLVHKSKSQLQPDIVCHILESEKTNFAIWIWLINRKILATTNKFIVLMIIREQFSLDLWPLNLVRLVWLPSFWLLDLSCLKHFASFCINVKYLLPLPGFKVEVSRVSTEMAL